VIRTYVRYDLRRTHASTAVDHPKLALEQLAAITDDQQIADIRAAAEVALATFDAWRQSPYWNRHERTY
jgi:hypothetical protein